MEGPGRRLTRPALLRSAGLLAGTAALALFLFLQRYFFEGIAGAVKS